MTHSAKLGLLLVALVSAAAGCINIPYLHPPQLESGPAALQQQRAQQFDPFPDTDIGPSVDGGRPEGYTSPMPETARGNPNNRWNQVPFR